MDADIVRSAYRKLKSYIYYDNSNLLLRQRLADFESDGDIDKKLIDLSINISLYSPDGDYWKSKFEDIHRWKIVKKYQPVSESGGLITNKRKENIHKVDRVNCFINCPIELHICAAIWAFQIGYKLELLMAIKPYGNKFSLKKEGDSFVVADGLKSYKPYFGQYQRWRDGAVNAAKELVDRDKNAIVLGLDIKDFYNSVRINFSDIYRSLFPEGVPEDLFNICSIFYRLHSVYTNKTLQENSEERCVLPIGLISSGVLANYYLDPLDRELTTKLRPEFYGRYVDDILLVASCADDQDVSDADSVAKQYLLESNIFNKAEGIDVYRMNLRGYEDITIQKEKLSVLHFVSSEPTALLDKFRSEIKRNSSEYRLLPEDEVLDYDFDQAAYNLNYSGNGNKLRDIKEFGEDKFGISKFLAKKIFIALQSGHKSDTEAVKKITRFFKGRRSIELYSLWEKVFTFLLVNDDEYAISEVSSEIIKSIKGIEAGEAQDWEDSGFYLHHLFVALSMAFSLKPSILKSEKFIDRLEFSIEKESFFSNFDFEKSINSIRKSNLLRHAYVVHPLLNYVGKNKRGEYYDLIDYVHYFKLSSKMLRISDEMYRYSPRFVHFYEVTLFDIINRISAGSSKFYLPGLTFSGSSKITDGKDYLTSSTRDFYRLNYIRKNESVNSSDKNYLDVRKGLYRVTFPKYENDWIRELDIQNGRPLDSLRIAVANMSIDEEVFSHAYLRSPSIRPIRRKNFNSILNQAEKENVDMLVLPEISVPVAWLKWVADYALRQQRAMIFGLEHWVVGTRAFNFIVTLMPFTSNGFKSLNVNIRLKNHYSPAEIEKLEGYGYVIPEVKNPSYDLFKWRGCHFTAFNCFELSNIEHRARFKSKIDLLVASEFNRDVNYFSSIVESSARDIHCYVAQVNDSKYGDSRVTQPAGSNSKDLINVKGGINPTILVEDIDFNKLREFQLKEYSGQKSLGSFKPTPPDFNRDNVLKRMKSSTNT